MIIFVGGRAFQIKRINGIEWAVSIGCAVPCLLWAVLLRSIPDKYAGALFGFVAKISMAIFRPLLKGLGVIFHPLVVGWRAVFAPAKRFSKRTVAKTMRKSSRTESGLSSGDEEAVVEMQTKKTVQSAELPRQPPPITLTTVA
jgi:Ca2+-transporting ATPase